MSPSWTTYSLPSSRTSPCSRQAAIVPRAMCAIVRHDLGADEPAREVGVDLARRRLRRRAAGNRPRAALVLAYREERDVAEQIVAGPDHAIQARLLQAQVREERRRVGRLQLARFRARSSRKPPRRACSAPRRSRRCPPAPAPARGPRRRRRRGRLRRRSARAAAASPTGTGTRAAAAGRPPRAETSAAARHSRVRAYTAPTTPARVRAPQCATSSGPSRAARGASRPPRGRQEAVRLPSRGHPGADRSSRRRAGSPRR